MIKKIDIHTHLTAFPDIVPPRLRDGSRFFWFCNVDPKAGSYSSDSDLEHIIGHYKELGAKGLGELTTQMYADDPMMDNLFGACERLDMPVLIHIAPQIGGTYGIVDEMNLPRIEKMLKKHYRRIKHSKHILANLLKKPKHQYGVFMRTSLYKKRRAFWGLCASTS